MANYFVIFNRQRNGPHPDTSRTYGSAKMLPSSTSPMSKVGVEDAKVVKLEAGSVAEAQAAVQYLCGGLTDTPVVVTEAQFKES